MNERKAIPLEAAIKAYERQQWRECSKVQPSLTGTYLVIRFEGDRGGVLQYDTEFKGWNLNPWAYDMLQVRANEIFPSHWCEMPDPIQKIEELEEEK